MYTQCPHCQTTFQVNSAQLKAAQGMVRCGSCHRIFNSLPRLIESNQKAKKLEEKEANFPVVESEEIFEEIEINPKGTEVDRPFLAKAKEMRKNVSSNNNNNKSSSPRSSRSTGNLDRSAVTTASIAKAKVAAIAKQNRSLKNTAEQQPAAKKSPKLKSPQLAGTTTASRVKEKLQQAKSRLRRQVTPQPEPFINDETIAGTELVNASAADVSHLDINENMPRFPEMRMPPPGSAPEKPKFYKSSTGIWSVSIIGLLLLLLVQYMYFFREDFIKVDSLRSIYDGVCSVFGCGYPLVDEPNKIKVVTDIRTHPDNAGALIINAILTNRHTMPQYYPMLELVLSNGKKTVVREFHPIEYMGKHVDLSRGLEHKKTVPVKLEIVDPFPNTDKVRFELNLRSSQKAN